VWFGRVNTLLYSTDWLRLGHFHLSHAGAPALFSRIPEIVGILRAEIAEEPLPDSTDSAVLTLSKR